MIKKIYETNIVVIIARNRFSPRLPTLGNRRAA